MKKVYILLAISLLIIAVGCTDGSPSTGGKTQPFLGGTIGLLIDFEQDLPPAEVYDAGEYPFDVEVKLQNAGETDVVASDVVVTLSGVRAEDFGISEGDLTKNPDDDIEGAKKDPEGQVIPGNVVYVTYEGLNYAGELAGNTPFTFMADVCYLYETRASAQLCVRSDNLDSDPGVCTVSESKTVYNSGAPVQIASFRESARSAGKIQFSFEVMHKGNGNIYMQSTTCEDERTNEDKVWVEVTTSIGGALDCMGLTDGSDTDGFVTLYGGSRQITCVQETDSSTDYETPVNIRVAYDYQEDISTKVLVKHSLE